MLLLLHAWLTLVFATDTTTWLTNDPAWSRNLEACNAITVSGYVCPNGYGENENDQTYGVNQVYVLAGQTLDGRPFYQGRTTSKHYIFYDSNCGGGEVDPSGNPLHSWRSGWLIGCQEPSRQAVSNLQGSSNGDCCNSANSNDQGADFPLGEVRMWSFCGGQGSGDLVYNITKSCSSQATTTTTMTGVTTTLTTSVSTTSSESTSIRKTTTTTRVVTPMASLSSTDSAVFNSLPLADSVEAIVAEIIRSISQGERVIVTYKGVITVAQRLSLADLVGDSVSVDGGEESVTSVTVPSSLLEDLGGDVVAVFTSFEKIQEYNPEEDHKPKGDVSKLRVEGIVSVKIMFPSSSVAHVHGLKDPIILTLPANASRGAECAYWDEENSAWSSEGLTTIEASEGRPLVCATTHLTAFAAIWRGIVKTVKCSNADMLSQEGLEAVVQTTWYLDKGPQVLGGMTLLMLLFTLAALSLEQVRSWKGHRDDACFFVVSPPDDMVEAEKVAEIEAPDEKQCICGSWSRVWGWWLKVVAGLGDICGFIFASLDEVRNLCVDDASARGSTPFLLYILICGLEHAVVSSVLLEAAAKLGMGQADVLHFMEVHKEKATEAAQNDRSGKGQAAPKKQRENGGNTSMHSGCNPDSVHEAVASTDCAAVGIRNKQTGRHDNSASKPDATHSEGTTTAKLQHQLTERHMQRMAFIEGLSEKVVVTVWITFKEAGSCCRHPVLVWRLFLMKNPWLSALHFSMFMPSSLAVFILLVLLAGNAAMCALFYTASGDVRITRKAQTLGNCEMDDAWESLGQLITISAATAITANIPTVMLQACHTRDFAEQYAEGTKEWHKQLWRWRFRDWFIWIAGNLWFAFCCFFCVVFLANVSSHDTDMWMTSVLISLLFQALVQPLFSALLLSTLAWMGLRSARIRGQSESRLHLNHRALDLALGSDRKDLPDTVADIDIDKKDLPGTVVDISSDRKDVPDTVADIAIDKKDLPGTVVEISSDRKDVPAAIVEFDMVVPGAVEGNGSKPNYRPQVKEV